MKIITIFFARKRKYHKLLRVFVNSCKKYMPDVNLEVVKIPKPPNVDHKRDTAYSFLVATKEALKHKKGILAIADCDLMFRKSILDLENCNFDIAVTTRKSKLKYNTGIWFMQPTKAAKKFVNTWEKETKNLIKNFCEYEEFCWSHGGIDQASLVLTLEKNKDAKILELPCLEWNATQSEWRDINENTKVIHIKSLLRKLCLTTDIIIDEKYKYLQPIIKEWKKYVAITR